MLSESELIYERQKLYSLMHDHPEWSLRAYARTLRHDLKWVRKWVNRLKALVIPTLDMFRSHWRKPKRSPSNCRRHSKTPFAPYGRACQNALTDLPEPKPSSII